MRICVRSRMDGVKAPPREHSQCAHIWPTRSSMNCLPQWVLAADRKFLPQSGLRFGEIAALRIRTEICSTAAQTSMIR